MGEGTEGVASVGLMKTRRMVETTLIEGFVVGKRGQTVEAQEKVGIGRTCSMGPGRRYLKWQAVVLFLGQHHQHH